MRTLFIHCNTWGICFAIYGSKCEMETSWQLFCEKKWWRNAFNNERTIPYVFVILCCILLLHLSVMFSHIIRFHSEAAKSTSESHNIYNGFLATRGYSILGGLFENYTQSVLCDVIHVHRPWRLWNHVLLWSKLNARLGNSIISWQVIDCVCLRAKTLTRFPPQYAYGPKPFCVRGRYAAFPE